MIFLDRGICLNNDKMLPDKYWFYISGLVVFFLLLFFVPFVRVEGFGAAIISMVLIAIVFTTLLLVVHHLWFSDSIILKILALVFGGFVAVLIVIFIQFVYENVILKSNN